MVSKLKRWLYLTHRWLGVVLCLFLAMWFFSGIVMMYVGYPKLTEQERLSHLPALVLTDLLSPAEAFAHTGVTGPVRDLSLNASWAGQPVYQAWFEDGKRLLVNAHDGSPLFGADPAVALSSARVFAGPGVSVKHEGFVQEDAFTHSRALDRHRPLHRISLADEAGTWLYVSGVTGEVVRDASRLERNWNYVGAWIHWLYPFRGNVFNSQWANIVNWLSITGLLLTVTGAIVGVLRWRFMRPYRSGSRSPYPGLMMRWHHKTGLIFAVITLTWLFSGLVSMGPWGFLREPGLTQHLTRMHGPLLLVNDLTEKPAALVGEGQGVHEMKWTRRLGHETVLLYNGGGIQRVISPASGDDLWFGQAEVVEAASHLFEAPLWRAERLDHYDLYYYDRAPHTMSGGRDKPLPVVRVRYGDQAQTWVHIDLRTAQILDRSDANSRLRRWLFQMLHSWDWLPLLERRPLWDIVMVLLSLGGLALSVTGVVIGWRRLRVKTRFFR
jgi:uncharacterized iron-regulated membrane protein